MRLRITVTRIDDAGVSGKPRSVLLEKHEAVEFRGGVSKLEERASDTFKQAPYRKISDALEKL